MGVDIVKKTKGNNPPSLSFETTSILSKIVSATATKKSFFCFVFWISKLCQLNTKIINGPSFKP